MGADFELDERRGGNVFELRWSRVSVVERGREWREGEVREGRWKGGKVKRESARGRRTAKVREGRREGTYAVDLEPLASLTARRVVRHKGVGLLLELAELIDVLRVNALAKGIEVGGLS